MAGTHGSVLVPFKVAYMALLDNYATGATYDSPQSPEDILGSAGAGVGSWFADEAEIRHSVEVFKGLPAWVDEHVEVPLRIQAIATSTDDTQAVVDARASQVLFYALAILLNDPSVGLVDDDIETFTAMPGSTGIRYDSGVLGTNARVARFEFTIEIDARLKLVLP